MDFLGKLGIDVGKLLEVVWQLDWLSLLRVAAEIFIICYAVFWVWGRIVNTQAERLVKGLFILTFGCCLSWLCGFTLITTILQHLILVAALALVIIFQPELRRGLGYLGRAKTFKLDWTLANTDQDQLRRVIKEIIVAVRELSRTKVGGLVVVEPPEGERDYLSPGVTINGDVTSNLLLTIFSQNSPLHDGAVVIRGTKLIAAGVILPMTDNPKLSYRYGTRHRAAVGLSEIYDGLCIVVSEETGSISVASRGMLVRYNSADDLEDPLSYLYHQNSEDTPTPLHSFLMLFARGRKESSEPGQVETSAQPKIVGALPTAQPVDATKIID